MFNGGRLCYDAVYSSDTGTTFRYIPPALLCPFTRLHNIVTQKTTIYIYLFLWKLEILYSEDSIEICIMMSCNVIDRWPTTLWPNYFCRVSSWPCKPLTMTWIIAEFSVWLGERSQDPPQVQRDRRGPTQCEPWVLFLSCGLAHAEEAPRGPEAGTTGWHERRTGWPRGQISHQVSIPQVPEACPTPLGLWCLSLISFNLLPLKNIIYIPVIFINQWSPGVVSTSGTN